MRTKTCFKCNETKPLSEFYRHPQMADGHLNKCKNCAKEDTRENRSKRRSQYSAYERQRFQEPQRRAYVYVQNTLYRKRNPQKVKARQIVSNAIRDGKLRRGFCKICGIEAQAHHEDYSKPLEVRWLCFKHHREVAHGQVVVAVA